MRMRCISAGALAYVALIALLCGCGEAQGARIRPVETTTYAKEVSPALAMPSIAPTTISSVAAPLPTSSPRPAPEGDGVLIRVYKADRELELWENGMLSHACSIGLGFGPEGHKYAEGDGRTPEGAYYVCIRNDQSRYYLSLGVSYPGAQDAQNAWNEQRITKEQCDAIVEAIEGGRRPPWDTPLGGEIMIHGHGGSSDWTAGCIAVDDSDMDVLWDKAAIGTAIEIYP